jgi:ankyrin repeat protein
MGYESFPSANAIEDCHNLAQLLLRHGADVNAQGKDTMAPLYLASREGQLEIAWVLLG